MAQMMTKKNNPDIGGLFCVTIGGSLEFPKVDEEKWMQIIHTGKDHWVLAAKGFSQPAHVLIYDSLPVMCHCRRTWYRLKSEQWDQIECENCQEWFHRMCEDYPEDTDATMFFILYNFFKQSSLLIKYVSKITQMTVMQTMFLYIV